MEKSQAGNKIRVAVGLSGGVDSAVSAYLLKKQGFDVSGVYLKCFDDDIPGCRGQLDRRDALTVALHLKIPFRILDFRQEYKAAVIGYFKKEYLAGRTPNPDVICNRDIKFGLLLDWCIKNGFNYLATGHYAKIVRAKSQGPNALSFLARPKDEHKDQTYFLWAVPKEKFSRVLFPLADYLKSEVRAIASRLAPLSGVADKPDSTGICFIGEVRVEDFLKKLGVKEKTGEVVIRTKDYKNYNNYKSYGFRVIGSHRGVWFYTIGQRHGFSVDRWPATDRPPLYVIAKDVKTNRLVVGFGAECYRGQFEVSGCNWLAPEKDSPSGTGRAVLCRIRHLGSLIPCEIIKICGDSLKIENCKLKIKLGAAQRGIAPGQSAVFYHKSGIVLGGGVIR